MELTPTSGLIMIDNGHFQYNSVCLGLFIYSISFILGDLPYLGSVFFCLSLNFKQISLYYATPIFFYFLGKYKMKKIINIGVIVIMTFFILWYPFLNQIPSVLGRIFPFQRGIFEDKVASFWCTMSTFIKFHHYFDSRVMLRFSLILTLLGISYPSFKLFKNPTRETLLYSLLNSSLSFYLFSFHVHEKTILFPMTALLLVPKSGFFKGWFLMISCFSMYPLMVKDEIKLVYLCLQVCFFLVLAEQTTEWRWWMYISLTGVLVIHFLMEFITPPSRYPHLFILFATSWSFLHFFYLFLDTHMELFHTTEKKKRE
jgi:alpha-1,3-glucosyltransferase